MIVLLRNLLCISFYFLISRKDILIKSDPCAEHVILTTSCPDICKDICVLYPTTIKCIDAPFGTCKRYKSNNHYCQVHCLSIPKDSASLVIYQRPTTNSSQSIEVPISFISKLILPRNIQQVSFIGNDTSLTLHPAFLSMSTYVQYLQIWKTKLMSMCMGSLPASLQYLEISVSDMKEAPEDLSNMNNLEFLQIFQSSLTTIPSGVYQLQQLHTLNIRKNPIKQVILTASEFEYIKNLSRFETNRIDSNNCPSYTQRVTWVQPPLLDGLAQSEMVHSFCILDEKSESSYDKDLLSNQKNGLNLVSLYLIIGISIIAVLGIIIAVRIRRSFTSKSEELIQPLNTCHNHNYGISTSKNDQIVSRLENNNTLLNSRVELEKIRFMEKLASGGYGSIFKATYQDQLVAVKVMLPQHSVKLLSNIRNFSREIEFSMDLKHRSIVSMIGVAWSNAYDLCAVVEYMDQGDLHQVLSSKSPLEMNWKIEKWSIMVSIAEALLYLHSRNPPIIHRDLKSRNVLLDSNKGTKLSDFGLSRYRKSREDDSSMTVWIGTLRWMAPEMFKGLEYTEKVDIYAFGLLLIELATHQLPFSQLFQNCGSSIDNREIMYAIPRGLFQPCFGNHCPPCIRDLSERCISMEPMNRPSSVQLVEELHGIIHVELESWV